MRIMSKWFWSIISGLGYIYGEISVKPSLLCFMVILVGWAPAHAQSFSWIRTPDEYRIYRQEQIDRDRERLIVDETTDIVLSLYGALQPDRTGKLEGRLTTTKGEFSLDAIMRARQVFESKGWIWTVTIPGMNSKTYELIISER